MDDQRPDPEELLKRVQEEEIRQERGKLKVFFGATAGVGKTFAMLQAAHEQMDEGADIVVGWIETHRRPETEGLLSGLEILPPRKFEYRGVVLREFDLDAAILRRPHLILVDELAHTNAPGSRHLKRWQDVQELLAAGIGVFTTLNVQHLESLNDVVAQITGVVVRETVPDSILEQADAVELIDLPPDELLQRLQEGKVYLPEQAREAAEHFFKKGNLIALRELALRRTADRVDAEMQIYRRDHAVDRTWPAAESIIVCVDWGPRSPRLVRAGRRMAASLHAKWIAVYVQTSRDLRRPEAHRGRVAETFRLAERLGAETVTLSGDDVAREILDYARMRNVTKIIVGKPLGARWREWVFRSLVSDLVRNSGEIDVYVITGEAGEARPFVRTAWRRGRNLWEYGQACLVVGICSALAWLMFPHFLQANLVMVYLLGIFIVAIRHGQGPSVLAAILSVAAFDFFFVPPFFSFAVQDSQYLVTFVVMLAISLQIGRLTGRMRQQADVARQRAWRTEVLYSMSRELATTRLVENLTRVAARHIREVFHCEVGLLLPDSARHLVLFQSEPPGFNISEGEKGVARWAFDHEEAAGLGTETLPGAGALYVPLVGSQGTVGVLSVRPDEPKGLAFPEQMRLLETFAGQFALAIERALLARDAQAAQVQAETERMRNMILSSISHDLRTPLATITGAASSLLEAKDIIGPASCKELIRAIFDEARRLDLQVKNLLDMTRLESGAVRLQKERHPLEEVAASALKRIEARLQARPVTTHFPPELPPVLIDRVLIEQVLINLLENALKYTPPKSPIDLSASQIDGAVLFQIADRGPGIPKGEEQLIFDKFYRAGPAREGGVGLGLTICRGVIEAHGGRIWAENRPDGGAVFRFTLPLRAEPVENPENRGRPDAEPRNQRSHY